MKYLTKSNGYAIYQTKVAIELNSPNTRNPESSLICHCYNYQSALRIAGAIATDKKLPLVVNFPSY